MELPHLLRHTVHTFGFNDADGKAAQAGDVLWAVIGSDPAPVFVKVPVNDIMTAILNTPINSICLEHLLDISLVGGSAGDTINKFY